jgi:hypothetical protein
LKGLKGMKKDEERYHCHLKGGGRTRYVACWQAYSNIITVEIYYVGTHPDRY